MGVCLNVKEETAEMEHILDKTKVASRQIKGHCYNYRQALAFVDCAVLPVLGYSAPHMQWNRGELQQLDVAWVGAEKMAWLLLLSHNTAVFCLPPEHGACKRDSGSLQAPPAGSGWRDSQPDCVRMGLACNLPSGRGKALYPRYRIQLQLATADM